jgi:hypothetical protein
MQVFYTNIKTKGKHGVSGVEKREMRNAILDYGALQHSPVQQPSFAEDRPAVSDMTVN